MQKLQVPTIIITALGATLCVYVIYKVLPPLVLVLHGTF
jgi:hypothetical protein